MNLLETLYRALRTGGATALNAHAYWGRCTHCDTTTPWLTNVWTGEYRCTRCGADQLRTDAD